jgi:hypothetical protein
MTGLRLGLRAVRRLGPNALWSFAAYRFSLGSGLTRARTPLRRWEDVGLVEAVLPGIPTDPSGYADFRARTDAPRFFPVARRPRSGGSEDILEAADDILGGTFRLFGGKGQALGNPPDWRAFPAPLRDRPPLADDSHWSRIALDAAGDDVRLVWELSRFGWIFPLASAYRLTGDDRYAEGCWSLIESWRAGNPPNRGVHWASGQEVALRILALAYSLHAFLPDWRERPERVTAVAEMVAASAERIPPTVTYARAQGNNHLLSEAAGLWTAGLLFPELRGSAGWRRQGRELLTEALLRQVFPDGGYVQHSVTYQRMAIELGLWCARLAELNGDPFESDSISALARLTRALARLVDPSSGLAPRFGPDDGTHLLPLEGNPASDLRPSLEAGARGFLGESWYDGAGALADTLGLGSGRRTDPPSADDLPNAGLYFAGGGESRAVFRCARFRGRPGHSDQLHVDLWWGDENLALDPGSYLYNGPAPWDNALAGSVVHNTPIIDGQEPMERAGRFLWVGDADAVVRPTRGKEIELLEGVFNGYRRFGVVLRRMVARRGTSTWVVLDQAKGLGRHRMTVGWNLPDLPRTWQDDSLRLETARGPIVVDWNGDSVTAGLVRGGGLVEGNLATEAVELLGWYSPRYGERATCLRLVLEVEGSDLVRLSTRFSLGARAERAGLPAWPEDADTSTSKRAA